MASPGWTFDNSRGEHCYWSAHEGCWVYQSGSRVYPSTQSQQESSAPRSGPTVTSIHERSTSGASSLEGNDNYDLSSAFTNLNVSAEEEIPATAYGAYGYNVDHVQRVFQAAPTVPYESITDPELLQHGIYASKKLIATSEPHERLDPKYRVRKHARQFFVIGKVFRVLWPELLGDTAVSTMTECTGHYGEHVYTKIRWFVVIRSGRYDCACLPIQTYGGKGVAKPHLTKNDHAIIYTGLNAPNPKRNERPTAHDEGGMRPPVRVVGKRRTDKMDKMSRVNYRKIYTVEHNIKVCEFGDVHKDDVESLVSNFNDVWQFGSGSVTPRASQQNPHTEEEEGEAEGDSVDEEDSGGEGEEGEEEGEDEEEE